MVFVVSFSILSVYVCHSVKILGMFDGQVDFTNGVYRICGIRYYQLKINLNIFKMSLCIVYDGIHSSEQYKSLQVVFLISSC